MSKNPTKSPNIQLNYQKFVLKCDNLLDSDKPSFKTIQKHIQPFCKTRLTGSMLMTIRLKGTETHLKIIKTHECYVLGVYYYSVTKTGCPFTLEISATNLKELFYKINHRYNLLSA